MFGLQLDEFRSRIRKGKPSSRQQYSKVREKLFRVPISSQHQEFAIQKGIAVGWDGLGNPTEEQIADDLLDYVPVRSSCWEKERGGRATS